MPAKPFDMWYWNDWKSDMGVMNCSLAAQGLWVNMLGTIKSSPVPGYLCYPDGSPAVTPEDVEDLLSFCFSKRSNNPPVAGLLDELRRNHVFEEDEIGIFNRRKKREATLSLIRSEAGRKGGRPKAKKQNGNQNRKQNTNQKLKQNVKAKRKATYNYNYNYNISFNINNLVEQVKMSEDQPELDRVICWVTDLNQIFRRKNATIWDQKKEVEPMLEIMERPQSDQERTVIRRHYTESGDEYLRREMATLFNNWTGAIDKAEKWLATRKPDRAAIKKCEEQKVAADRKKVLEAKAQSAEDEKRYMAYACGQVGMTARLSKYVLDNQAEIKRIIYRIIRDQKVKSPSDTEFRKRLFNRGFKEAADIPIIAMLIGDMVTDGHVTYNEKEGTFYAKNQDN